MTSRTPAPAVPPLLRSRVAALLWGAVAAVAGAGWLLDRYALPVLAVAVAAALYARYLWRGGSVVLLPLPLWLWVPVVAWRARRAARRPPG